MKLAERTLTRLIEELCGLCGLALLFIALAQIIFRVFFNTPIIWVPEVSSVLLQYMVFFGGSIVMLSGRAAVVSLFVDRIPILAIRRAIDVFASFLSVSMGVALLKGSITYLGMQRTFTFANIKLRAEFIVVPCALFAVSLVWYGIRNTYMVLRGIEINLGEANPI